MPEKIEVYVDKHGRLTLPPDIRKHLNLGKNDDIWMEKTEDGKIVIGRIEVKRYVR